MAHHRRAVALEPDAPEHRVARERRVVAAGGDELLDRCRALRRPVLVVPGADHQPVPVGESVDLFEIARDRVVQDEACALRPRRAEWAERAGFVLDYAISSDLEQVEGLTDGYRLVIGAGHDEYWSAAGRDTIERFVAAGGNYASFSGNTMFWRVRLERDGTSMVCHKYSAHETDPIVTDDPSAVTGMWSDPVAGRTERGLLGAASMYGLYARFGQATPRGVPGFVVYRPDHWLLDGTGLRYGDMLGADDAVVGYETVGTKIASTR